MADAATGQQENQPLFNIEKLYVRDLSLEIPHGATVFLEREQPQIELQLSSQAGSIQDGVYEVTLTVTVTAKLPESAGNKVLFLIEAKQSGIFRILNVGSELDMVLGVVCPNILYPYIREVVSDISVRAGFAPVLLAPLNFDALYQQQKQQADTASSPSAH